MLLGKPLDGAGNDIFGGLSAVCGRSGTHHGPAADFGASDGVSRLPRETRRSQGLLPQHVSVRLACERTLCRADRVTKLRLKPTIDYRL
jgi:hypothetical protein